MKKTLKKQILAFMLLAAAAIPVHADELVWMEIVINNYTDMTRLQLQSTPTILFHGDYAIVQSSGYTVEEIPVASIDKIHYMTQAQLDGIENTTFKTNIVFNNNCITATGLTSKPSVDVFDITGKKMRAEVENGANSVTINLESLQKGVYVVRINKQSFKITKK